MNRNLVYELTEQKICPGSYSFTWDGTVNVMYGEGYPPEEWDNIAPAGLYTFDVEVMGPAYYYDADWLRSRNLKVGEHKVKFITPRVIEGWYVLYSNRDASEAWMEVYDPDFEKVAEVTGTTHTIPESTTPMEQDWNKTERLWVGFNKIGTWFFVFWAKDNFPDFDKAHRRKTCLPLNTERPKGWILSYGYTYTNLNTSDLADEVAGLVSNIKEDSEAKPGYERVESNASDPLNVAKEIGEVAAVRRETKSMPGLIHFAGHGAYIKWPERVVLFDNTIEFPRADRCGHKWLGIVTEGYARMIYNVESIREYIKGVEKPLKNVRVVLLFGCITGPDLPQKFFDLGTQAAVGTNKIMWFDYHKLFVTVFWRSLALGLCVHDAINKGINSVNNELKRKGEYYYITYRLWSTYFVVKGDPTTLIIY